MALVTFYVVRSFAISLGVTTPRKKHKHSKIIHTRISNDFKDMYEYILATYAMQLESNRKELLKSIMICIILFAISFTIWLILKITFDISSKSGNIVLAIIFIPTIFYYVFKYKRYNKTYISNYKDKIIRNFVEHINHSLTYHEHGSKKLSNYYLEAEFEDREFNNFESDDYIEGYKEDGTNIKLGNFALRNVSEKGEFRNVVYEGIFSVAEINKHLTEELRIKKNKYIFNGNINKVEMDSNEFEKYFDVYSSSNILAMEILTHDVMEELVGFYENYKIKFEIIIKDNKIYIRFDTGIMFEPNILKKSSDMNTLWVYYSVINFVITLTSKINNILNDSEI